ncbi:Dps family protein [uncultured Caulobacter sp.]|jgi:starvation-inducible DNA-binding protein|uniref:Dps family protein n=1 Tax=uncultured Caulobacter sp. TaxID=158749 RepID=UPI002614A29C|nr:Dps family protein [uncultured Caulobacter sp.]
MADALNTGLTAKQRAEIAASLNKVLADSYALYLKTHGYHWNVRGPNFQSLHVLLEGQYQEEWAALDDIAERIRALGELAPQGYAAFGNLSSIKDGDPEGDWEAMLTELKADNETVIRTLREAFPVADDAGDEATADLLTQRLQAHEKHAWMLRSTLGGK